MKTATHYSRTQVALHWAIVLLVAAQYLLSDGIEALWDQRMAGTIPNEGTPNIHTVAGMLILVLTIWRVVLKRKRGAVALPEGEPTILKFAAHGTHILFYVLLLGMPISGFSAWFIGLSQPADVHEIAAKVMLALIALHVTASIAHKVWFKSGVLERMSPRIILRGQPKQETPK